MTVSANGRNSWRHDAADEAERQEHADRRDRRRGDRARDLLGAVDRRREAGFAHGAVAVDVLEDDDRVVDDPSDGDREAAQGHDVQGDPGRLHDHEGGEDRERDADRGDDRRADAEQEQEDRQDREQGAEAALAEQPVAGLLDEQRQVRDDRDGDGVLVLLAQLGELGGDGVGDQDGVGVRGLGDRQGQRGLAVGARVAGRRDALELDRAEVADRDRRRGGGRGGRWRCGSVRGVGIGDRRRPAP